MFEQDYLMRIIAQLLGAIRRSMERAAGEEDPDGAAPGPRYGPGRCHRSGWRGAALPRARIAGLGAAGVGGRPAPYREYIARSLMLSGRYHGEAGRADMAELRRAQGRAVAAAFGHELGSDPVSDEALEALMTASDGEA